MATETDHVTLFEIGEEEWYAACTAEEAIAQFEADTGISVSEEGYRVSEVTPDRLDRLTFVDDDERRMTFRQRLRDLIASGQEFPVAFASGNH